MNTELLLNRDMNNIVFEGRNMAYGAYALRRKYEDRMTTAMLAGILIFVAIFLFASMLQKMGLTKEMFVEKVITFEPDPIFAPKLSTPKPKPAVQPASSSPKKPPVQSAIPTVVKEIDKEPAEIPKQTSLIINPEPEKGFIDSSRVYNLEPVDPTFQGSSTTTTTPHPEDSPREMYAVDQMPEFPGGEAEMYKFIRKNMEIPVLAKEMNESMNAIVQFIIDKNGNVRDVKIIRSSSAMINKSAINVVNEMPKWKPGKFRGQSVDVIFKLPIKIHIQ